MKSQDCEIGRSTLIGHLPPVVYIGAQSWGIGSDVMIGKIREAAKSRRIIWTKSWIDTRRSLRASDQYFATTSVGFASCLEEQS